MTLRKKKPRLEILARAPLPTLHGLFEMSIFRWGPGSVSLGLSADHIAIVMGDPRGKRDVLLRIHSECLTSEVFGSVLCDCRAQLDAAQAQIARAGEGVLLYLRQEGRGIGITNKVRAYELQANGHDTVDANRLLGFPDDARDYSAAAAMLHHLGIVSVRLMTNNPMKVTALRDLGIPVRAQCALVRADDPRAAQYLETKRVRMGHALPPLEDLRPEGFDHTS
ncbi:MAG TPA: GTP cyclohydrolase II [Thermoanaerobaculia bacterium]|jgi:GTP cyclohydrolase II|nr:GTP cyclohydrolase II [Thermoanaerobaculia bacterium]